MSVCAASMFVGKSGQRSSSFTAIQLVGINGAVRTTIINPNTHIVRGCCCFVRCLPVYHRITFTTPIWQPSSAHPVVRMPKCAWWCTLHYSTAFRVKHLYWLCECSAFVCGPFVPITCVHSLTHKHINLTARVCVRVYAYSFIDAEFSTNNHSNRFRATRPENRPFDVCRDCPVRWVFIGESQSYLAALPWTRRRPICCPAACTRICGLMFAMSIASHLGIIRRICG